MPGVRHLYPDTGEPSLEPPGLHELRACHPWRTRLRRDHAAHLRLALVEIELERGAGGMGTSERRVRGSLGPETIQG